MSVAGDYSLAWFETFADGLPADIVAAEVAGLERVLPMPAYRRVLDVGCGVGRVAGAMAASGYDVVGLDVNLAALKRARARHPAPKYVALDQRRIGCLRASFDAVVVLWNSLGFDGREGDRETLTGIASALRRRGRLVLDLYHPGWLRANERHGGWDDRGARVRRWIANGRCSHEIEYPDGHTDRMSFEVYLPEELQALCEDVGLTPIMELVGWTEARPSADSARYQLVCERMDEGGREAR